MTHYHRRIARGLCVRCGCPMDESGTYCRACAKERSEARRTRYRANVEQGVCPSCGRRREDRRVHCEACRHREKVRACRSC